MSTFQLYVEGEGLLKLLHKTEVDTCGGVYKNSTYKEFCVCFKDKRNAAMYFQATSLEMFIKKGSLTNSYETCPFHLFKNFWWEGRNAS